MDYYRLFNPIVLVRKLSSKGILSNVHLESKDYICVQLACNLASTYILNLTVYQFCSMQIIFTISQLTPKTLMLYFPFLVLSKWYKCLFLLLFIFTSCPFFKALFFKFLLPFIGGHFQWHLFSFIHPSNFHCSI